MCDAFLCSMCSQVAEGQCSGEGSMERGQNVLLLPVHGSCQAPLQNACERHEEGESTETLM